MQLCTDYIGAGNPVIVKLLYAWLKCIGVFCTDKPDHLDRKFDRLAQGYLPINKNVEYL